jgi:hypothetical protein
MTPMPLSATVDGRSPRVAVVMSNALGDTLVLMVAVQNCLRNGIDITVFGRQACALRRWFPGVTIHPIPHREHGAAWLVCYDVVIQMHRHQPVPDLTAAHPNVLYLDSVELGDRPGCMAERFAGFCREELGLSHVGTDNGITPPPSLQHRRHRRRVVIHPEASTDDKRWRRARFIKLAHRLREHGYDVHFVIAPHERERWKGLGTSALHAATFHDLHELACWLYESGWFIGNDSGVGHLASNLGIPTLSLFRRRRVAQRWRPGWGAGHVVLPWQWVPGAWLKEKLWRQTLTCARVLAGFHRMVRECEAG